MLIALENSLGVVTPACSIVGIARETHYKWLRVDEAYKTAVESIKDIAIDFVESKQFKLIKEENPTLIIFYLKTQGKGRGYVERTEVDTNQKISFNIDSDDIDL